MPKTITLLVIAISLSACANTARGVQKDMERTGEVIIDTTRR